MARAVAIFRGGSGWTAQARRILRVRIGEDSESLEPHALRPGVAFLPYIRLMIPQVHSCILCTTRQRHYLPQPIYHI